MNDRIVVTGIRALGRHGANPGERDHPQPFDVDVTLTIDAARAATLDRIEDTVNYTTIVGEVRRTVAEESFALVESLAQALADRVLMLGGVAVRVRVSKPGAARSLGVSGVAVEVDRPAPPELERD